MSTSGTNSVGYGMFQFNSASWAQEMKAAGGEAARNLETAMTAVKNAKTSEERLSASIALNEAQQVYTFITNMIKKVHDTMMQAINLIR
ncbi:MAG: hypothetical protein KDD60_01330 [Bdellovibrionales bacterium]|nr:hypothetical protein [Bdellovibrionales bacterium]